MNLAAGLHRLAQIERDLRREIAEPADKLDLRYATDEELDALMELRRLDDGHFHPEDEPEGQRIIEAIAARAAEGGPPPDQIRYVPIASGPVVELAFLGSGTDEPLEPELALDLLPKLEEEARGRQGHRSDLTPMSEEGSEAAEKAAAMVGVGRSSVAAAKAPEPEETPASLRPKPGDPISPRAWVSQHERAKWSDARGILEREF